MDTRDVLWTGGWDSTFRVLMLALCEGVRVRPHYLVDPERRSARHEQHAIERLRTAAVERGGAIAPIRVQPVEAIPIHPDAAARHAALVRARGIGPQYLWLFEYARQQGIAELELCIHVDDKAYAAVRAPPGPEADAAADLFRPFRFPLLEVSKVQMREMARSHGFDDLMELTWFCHLPTRSGKPCGFCSPCRWTTGEGLADRLTRLARARGRLDQVVVSRIPSYRLRHAIRGRLRALG